MEQISTLEFEKKFLDNGYVKIKVNGYWYAEHRWVCEQFIGRELKEDEEVHHDDFNPANNNIFNLTLFPTSKSHSHFHRKIRQFSMTQPRITEISELKEAMVIESIKNNRLKLGEI